jgi:hypothetical protein
MALPSSPDTAHRLARLKAEVAAEFARRPTPASGSPRGRSRKLGHLSRNRLIGLALAAILVLVLPFLLLVRGSVWLYAGRGYPVWLALTLAAAATLLLVAAYGAWLMQRWTGRPRLGTVVRWVALPLVLGYTGHALLYLSRTHAKDDQVQAEYRATHPLLRLALSTLMLTTGDLVITDLRRAPADYARMGLPLNRESLHYRQRDGWTHAVDLRTIGQTAVENWLVDHYFRLMGFRTLRHVGTEDHLHVELPVP